MVGTPTTTCAGPTTTAGTTRLSNTYCGQHQPQLLAPSAVCRAAQRLANLCLAGVVPRTVSPGTQKLFSTVVSRSGALRSGQLRNAARQSNSFLTIILISSVDFSPTAPHWMEWSGWQ